MNVIKPDLFGNGGMCNIVGMFCATYENFTRIFLQHLRQLP
jgi:hypothetical protein